jgi:hypothetical protein
MLVVVLMISVTITDGLIRWTNLAIQADTPVRLRGGLTVHVR